jgi:chemotaxis protein methyltransferase CheR
MSETFNEFNIWAKKNLNMNLESYKEKQLQRRILNVMSNHSVSNLNDYMKLMEKDIAAREELKNYLTINVTEFFRNPELFESL